MKSFQVLLLLMALWLAPSLAFGEKKKSDPGPHPLKILKVVRDNRGSNLAEARGEMQIWLQNAVDADIDKVKLEIELYSASGRYLDKVTKDIGVIKANSKSYQTIRWSTSESALHQKIWIYYNRGAERLTQYEAEPPVW